MGAREIFQKFFEPDVADQDAAASEVEESALFLEFARTLFYPKLISHLEEQALKPIPLGDGMLQSAARANAYKELREWLKGNERRAERVIAGKMAQE